MTIDDLTVERFIVQEVPRRRPDTIPIPTEIETEGDDPLREHIRNKLVSALLRHKLEIRFSDALSPATREIAGSLMTGTMDLVTASQALQTGLYTQQDGRTSAGVLVVVLTQSATGAGVALIKAEAEAGVRLQPELVENRRKYSLEHIRDLVFTGNSRFYKIALFERAPDGSGEMRGYHADLQLGSRAGGLGADYFLSSFLGCVPAAEPANVIAQVWDGAVDFFNTVEDASLRVQYLTDLQSEMVSNRSRFVVDDFAAAHLQVEHQDELRRAVMEHEVDPSASLVKDTSRIVHKIKKMRIAFQSGITLVGTTDSMDEHVTQEADENGAERTIISDKVKYVGSN